MVKVGIDVHKHTHSAVGVDPMGREPAQRTVRATDAGHRQLLRWARENFGADVEFAVEDCRHVSTRLERALLAGGARVVRVPPELMAGARASARTRGKSDPIDALAVARAAWREPNLPVATLEGLEREMKLLVDHREDLVNARTRAQNRLRRHLRVLDPELDPPARQLDTFRILDQLAGWLAEQQQSVVVRIAAELVVDIRDLTVRERALERELADLVASVAPRLLALPGCGVLSAAKLIGDTANRGRFRSEACFAMHAGVAPIPASSGQNEPPPPGPWRQPPTQRRAAPHRRHPDPPARTRPRVLPTPPRQRELENGSPPSPQTTPGKRRVQPARTRPGRGRDLRSGRRLT